MEVTTEMHGRAARGPRRQGCNRGAVRGLRAVRRHMASTAGAVPGAMLGWREPSGWRRRRCEQDRFTAPGGRRPRAPGRVNSCPQDLTGVAGTAMRQPLAPVHGTCSRPAHIAVPAGRRPAVAAPYGKCGEITYSYRRYRRPWGSDASVIGLSGTESGPRGRDHGTPGGHRGRRRIAHFVYTCRKPNATPMT